MITKLHKWWQAIQLHPVRTGIIALLIVIALIFVGYWFDWTGFNKSSITWTVKAPNGTTSYTVDEQQPPKALWDWLQLGSSIATTLAVVAAAVWFIWRRASAKSLQITLKLAGVTMVNSDRVAIIRVQLKNNGRTRIKTQQVKDDEGGQESESCYFSAKEVKVFSQKPITSLTKRRFESGRILIFKKLIELEPNEVVSEDIPLALKITLFEVRVEFHTVGTESWGATAVFIADEKTKNSSTIDVPLEQAASSR